MDHNQTTLCVQCPQHFGRTADWQFLKGPRRGNFQCFQSDSGGEECEESVMRLDIVYQQ